MISKFQHNQSQGHDQCNIVYVVSYHIILTSHDINMDNIHYFISLILLHVVTRHVRESQMPWAAKFHLRQADSY